MGLQVHAARMGRSVNSCNTLVEKKHKKQERRTWSDNKVRDLATVCLPWQHGTKALVWFDDDTSAFHSCVVLIYGSLILSGIYYCLRVFWCAVAGMSELELEQRRNIKFLVVS